MESTTGKTIKCKAAVLWEYKKPMVVEEIEVAPPKAGEVRVKYVATSFCGTDAHIVSGRSVEGANFDLPIIPGHEGAGIVESVGDGVTSVKPGDKIIPIWLPQCGQCPACKSPKSNICAVRNFTTCATMVDGTSRITCRGKPVSRLAGTSTFSEYMVLEECAVAKIGDDVDLVKSCVIGCCVGTGYGSAINLGQVLPGSTCAIWGLGAVGLCTALGCKDAGAAKIIGIDINPDKFEMARKFGCTEFINPLTSKQSVAEIFAPTGGLDYAFDCIGNEKVTTDALNALAPWGTFVLVGVCPKGSIISNKCSLLLLGQTYRGGFYGGYRAKSGVQELVDKYQNGQLSTIDNLITHTLTLDRINEAYELLNEGKSIRTLIRL